jgi:DsbC/DsbD-like thiol-disulfide interchange protein
MKISFILAFLLVNFTIFANDFNLKNETKIAVGGLENGTLYASFYIKLENGWDMYSHPNKFSVSTARQNQTSKVFFPKSFVKQENLTSGDITETVYVGEVLIPFTISNIHPSEEVIRLVIKYKTCNQELCVPHVKEVKVQTSYFNAEWMNYIKEAIKSNQTTKAAKFFRAIYKGIRFIPDTITRFLF